MSLAMYIPSNRDQYSVNDRVSKIIAIVHLIATLTAHKYTVSGVWYKRCI